MHCVPARAHSEPDYFVDLTEMKDAEPGRASNRLMAETKNYTALQAPGIKSDSHLLPQMETGSFSWANNLLMIFIPCADL